MIKSRTVTLFFLSVAFAVGAAWIANNWISAQQPSVAKQEVVGTPVVVAALDIPYGHTIEKRHLKVVMMPEEVAPSNSYRAVSDLEGKVAKNIMLPDEIIRSERVSDHLEGATLAALIEPNMRAFTVRVDDVVGVGGFLLPGNRVDVIASRASGKSKRVITETVLRDLKVLAVDQTARTDKNEPIVVRAVTLEVTPREAERLAKARGEGSIQLTLRNPTEDEPQQQVATAKPKPKIKRTYSAPPKVIVIKGTEWQSKKVPM
ncbi:Flp pilus assembly protein CpaB [Pontibacterium granulatum]|uniref:Flp pilus assembly protein CpaB n=1 Tax=Pontibacterium granulatum TaxID=2036029 RepID=UPI00249B8E6A|nr:Flp pilus assembly protein CpaB [Pontibacterium granulatum]MDI3323803.1 Flp pilus assembly protein CpaB [Pontibacterium granulatum]